MTVELTRARARDNVKRTDYLRDELSRLASNDLFSVAIEIYDLQHGEFSKDTVQAQPSASRNAGPFGL